MRAQLVLTNIILVVAFHLNLNFILASVILWFISLIAALIGDMNKSL